jgi:hypothetical protein
MPGIIDPTRSVQIDLSKAIPFLPLVTPELLRDFFAACALVGMIAESMEAGSMPPEQHVGLIADGAYVVADAMLKAREKSD